MSEPFLKILMRFSNANAVVDLRMEVPTWRDEACLGGAPWFKLKRPRVRNKRLWTTVYSREASRATTLVALSGSWFNC